MNYLEFVIDQIAYAFKFLFIDFVLPVINIPIGFFISGIVFVHILLDILFDVIGIESRAVQHDVSDEYRPTKRRKKR